MIAKIAKCVTVKLNLLQESKLQNREEETQSDEKRG